MDANGELSFKTNDGTFYQSTDFYAQITDKDEVFSWLKRKRVFNQLAKTDINTNTLKAWIKERMATGKPVPIEGVNCYYETSVRFKKGVSKNGSKENNSGS